MRPATGSGGRRREKASKSDYFAQRASATTLAMTYYVTTPIYYVNAEPHLGHAYSTMAADILARHMRQRGEDVFFLTGTDEHGEPIELAAEREGISPQELADRNAEKFRELMPIIDATNDFFIRTSDPRHAERVAEIIQRVYDNGWVTQGHLRGLVLPALRGLQDRARAGARPDLPDPRDRAGEAARGELVLPALRLPGAARSAIRGTAGLRRPRLPPQRGGLLHQAGPRGRLPLAAAAEVGDEAALGSRAAHVRLVRRAAQLLHGPLFAREGEDLTEEVLAGRPARDGEGHPQVPRGDLACAALGGGPRAPAEDGHPRLSADGREEDVEEPRQRPRPVRGDRPLRRRCAAPLPLPRGQLRPGRLDLHGRVRGPLRDRAGQRLREPGEPGAGDDRPLPGRRRARSRGRRGARPRTSRARCLAFASCSTGRS